MIINSKPRQGTIEMIRALEILKDSRKCCFMFTRSD